MATVSIPRELTENEFRKLNLIWDANRNVSVQIPEDLSEADVVRIFRLLLSGLPNEFAFCVLENLAEREKISMDLLSILFDQGDTGCNVAICLRDDLSKDIVERCRSSNIEEVREHFLWKTNGNKGSKTIKPFAMASPNKAPSVPYTLGAFATNECVPASRFSVER